MAQARIGKKLDQWLDRWLSDVPQVTCFTQKMKVYAPTCYGKCEEAVDDLVEELNEVLGGCTVYDKATGCWFNDEKGEVECEPVRVIEAAHSCADDKTLSKMVSAIKKYAAKADQYSVSIVNGQFFIAKTEELVRQFEQLQKTLPQ